MNYPAGLTEPPGLYCHSNHGDVWVDIPLEMHYFYGLIPYAENSSERAAGTAEGRDLTPGKPLWHGHDQGLCRKGISFSQFQKFMNNNRSHMQVDGGCFAITLCVCVCVGGRPLAAAHAEDGRQTQAGQRFCGLLQNLGTGTFLCLHNLHADSQVRL